jgi:CRP/FNR family transcriptional regulator, cyclic AMP receptor protein
MASSQIIGRSRQPVDGVALLRSHPVFGELELSQVRQLCSYARKRVVASGTTLFVKGDPGSALFAVCTGTVKITAPSIDGREAMYNMLHAGEIFGEIALLDGKPRTADAVALSACELMVIERRDFLTFMRGEPKVAMKLIELLCARLRFASARLEEVVFLSLPARLARMLIRLLEDADASAGQGKLNITQREISQMLGTTRESVNKQLRIWAKDKLIALKRGGIVVLAPKALAALVGGTDHDDANDLAIGRSGARRP